MSSKFKEKLIAELPSLTFLHSSPPPIDKRAACQEQEGQSRQAHPKFEHCAEK